MKSKNEAARELKAKQAEMLEMGYTVGPLEFEKHRALFKHRARDGASWVTYQKSFDPPKPEFEIGIEGYFTGANSVRYIGTFKDGSNGEYFSNEQDGSFAGFEPLSVFSELKMLRDDKMSLQSKNDELEKTIKRISEA